MDAECGYTILKSFNIITVVYQFSTHSTMGICYNVLALDTILFPQHIFQ